MFHKDLLETLQDIAKSLRVLAKMDSDFPVKLTKELEKPITVVSSNLPEILANEEKVREEKLQEQIGKRQSEGFFFGEDAADVDLITGGIL